MTYIPKSNLVEAVPIGTIIAIHPSVNISKALDLNYWKLCDSTGDTFDLDYADNTQTAGVSRPDLSDERFLMGGSTYERDGSNNVMDHCHEVSQTCLGSASINKTCLNTNQETHCHTASQTCTGLSYVNKNVLNTNQYSHVHLVGGYTATTYSNGTVYWREEASGTWTAVHGNSHAASTGSWGITSGAQGRSQNATSYASWSSVNVTSRANHCHTVSYNANSTVSWNDASITSADDHTHSVVINNVVESLVGQNRPQYFKVKYYIKIK